MDCVIVTFNSAVDLSVQLGCQPLRSAFDRVLVVDNASRDESVAIARNAGADVVERGVNDSLAAAINLGVRGSQGPIVGVLNPDILITDDDVLPRLMRHFDDPSVGVVAPGLVLPNGRQQDSARRVPDPVQLLRRRLTGRESGAMHASQPVDVDWVVAAFTLLRREAFDDVGGFDPRYRLYFEDVDLCVRMWSGGWRVRYDPTVSVRHEHRAASKKSLVGRPMRQHARSAAMFYRCHPDLLLASGRRRLRRPVRQGSPAPRPR